MYCEEKDKTCEKNFGPFIFRTIEISTKLSRESTAGGKIISCYYFSIGCSIYSSKLYTQIIFTSTFIKSEICNGRQIYIWLLRKGLSRCF